MRICGLDPGKQKDSFAMVGTEIKDKKIHVLGAKRWLGRAYLQVERELYKIDEAHPFDYYIVERNNTGEHVLEVLRYQYSLPVIAVTTVSLPKDEKRIFSPKFMDKVDMVRYMLIMFNDGRIVFPRNPQGEVKELLRQLSIFAEHKSDGPMGTGNVRYQAEGNEHDDLVMALMLACFYARMFVDKGENQPRIHHASKKMRPDEDEDLLGSGVREEYEVKQRSIYNPK